MSKFNQSYFVIRNNMELRSGKKYKREEFWWYKYTIDAGGEKNLEEIDKNLFMYRQHTFKEWLQNILPLYESSEAIKRYK